MEKHLGQAGGLSLPCDYGFEVDRETPTVLQERLVRLCWQRVIQAWSGLYKYAKHSSGRDDLPDASHWDEYTKVIDLKSGIHEKSNRVPSRDRVGAVRDSGCTTVRAGPQPAVPIRHEHSARSEAPPTTDAGRERFVRAASGWAEVEIE